jgi:glycosyltransferase involved in cell wall biosynthesis
MAVIAINLLRNAKEVRVLFDHPDPFSLAHGGVQTQIEQTRVALMGAGVEVDFLQWWNSSQKGDLIHFFGRPKADYIRQAHGQGCKVVMAELLSSTGARSGSQLALQRLCTNLYRKFMPATFTVRMAWDSYRLADACIALTPWEAHLMHYLFGAPKERTHVVPNGVEEVFFHPPQVERGQWLVCTATIRDIKRVLELGEAAVRAQTPVWIIGKPYAESDPYAQHFLALARQHPQVVRYEGAIQQRDRLAEVYSAARGFVLLSAFETRSIAAEEAAACGCALLLSDLPWARSVFGASASYCPLGAAAATARCLRVFYDAAPTLPKPPPPKSWPMVGQQLKEIYRSIVKPGG